MIGQSCVNKDGGCSTLSLSEESACRFLFGPFARWGRGKASKTKLKSLHFVTVPPSLFPFAVCFAACILKGQTRCPKDYERVSGLLLIQARLLRPPCFFLICRVAALGWQPITSSSFSGNTTNKTKISCRKLNLSPGGTPIYGLYRYGFWGYRSLNGVSVLPQLALCSRCDPRIG